MTPSQLWNTWERVWFKQSSAASLCLFRIIFASVVFVSNLLMAPDLLLYFGKNAIISIETIKDWQAPQRYFSLFYLFPIQSQDLIAYLVYAAVLLSSLFVALGLFTRLSTILLFISLLSFHNRMSPIFHSGDMLMRQQALLLCFAPAGMMFSLDSLIKKKKAVSTPNETQDFSCWSMLLLQILLSAVYCQTFLLKLNFEMWRDGTALYWATRLPEFSRFPVPYLFDHLWTVKILTWTALLIELSLWTLIWIKPIRYAVLIAGLCFHLAIEYSFNLGLFEYTMIASYVLFLEPADAKRFVDWLVAILARRKNVNPTITHEF